MRPFAIIAAMARNRVIGRDNQLPWHEPEDLAYFKKVTMGHPVIMGKNTHKSIGRLLPGRKNIVVGSSPDGVCAGAWFAESLDDALEGCPAKFDDMPFVIGGQKLYEAAIDHEHVSMLYLTFVDLKVEGDAYFPPFLGKRWEEVHSMRRGRLDFRVFVRD